MTRTANSFIVNSTVVNVTKKNRPYSNNFYASNVKVDEVKKHVTLYATCSQNSNEPGRIYHCLYGMNGLLLSCESIN